MSGLTYVASAAEAEGLIDGTMPFSQIVTAALAAAKNNKNKMAEKNSTARFQTVLAKASAEKFELCSEGFALNEAQWQSVEDSFAASDLALTAAKADTATANAEIVRLTAELATQKETATASGIVAAKTAADLVTANAEVIRLAALDVAPAVAAAIADDEKAATAKADSYRTPFDDYKPDY